MANVTVIKATKPKLIPGHSDFGRKLKVAAYARVSTERDEQENSFEAQVHYFKEKIQSNPKWEYVDLYADDGITGTSKKNRKGFKQLIDDALAGKIDLILVKSVSRFARNTVDSLEACRKLKSEGIDIFFEKENISIQEASGELLLTIFSSLAQEESRTISENVTWGIRAKFKTGEFMLPYKHFLGYRKGPDGKPEIVPEEAEIIKKIYRLFLEGNSYRNIANILESEGILTPTGKEKWSPNTILSILTNEKYCGDALLRKSYTVDFLEHKRVANTGEVEQFFVKNSHKGIVTRELFDFVQGEVLRRKQLHSSQGNSPFSGKLFCEHCSGLYGKKVWHSTDKYRRSVYHCNDRVKNGCGGSIITEEAIKETFVKAVDQITSIEDYCEICEVMIAHFSDHSAFEEQLTEAQLELESYESQMTQLLNSAAEGKGKKCAGIYDKLLSRYEETQQRIGEISQTIKANQQKASELRFFVNNLTELHGGCISFEKRLWYVLLDRAIVGEGKITYLFRDGERVTINL